MSRLPISMKRPNSARHESPIGIASPASALRTTSTPLPSVSSMTASAKSPRRESITCFTPSVLSKRAFARAAGGGDDFRAEVMRDLDRRHADAARARVDEDAFALAQPRHVLQRMPRSHEDHGQRRRFLERQIRRNAADIAAARQRLRGEAEYRETKHTISRRDVLHAGADCLDDTADFVAENARIRRIAGIKRERLEHVAEIHSRGFDVDQHFTRAAGRQRKRSEAQGVEMAALAGFEAQRQERIEPLLARRGDRGRVVGRSALRRGGRFRARRLCETVRSKAEAASDAEGSGGRSMPRQERLECSLKMTRNKPMAGACATAVGAGRGRPAGLRA